MSNKQDAMKIQVFVKIECRMHYRCNFTDSFFSPSKHEAIETAYLLMEAHHSMAHSKCKRNHTVTMEIKNDPKS
jgi:hypothetical protein